MEERRAIEELCGLFWKFLTSDEKGKRKFAAKIELFCMRIKSPSKGLKEIVDYCDRLRHYGKDPAEDKKTEKGMKLFFDELRALEEREIAGNLLEMLHGFLKAGGDARLKKGEKIHDFCKRIMERGYYIQFGGRLKYVLDQCFLLREWRENGVYFQGERVMSERIVLDIIEDIESLIGKTRRKRKKKSTRRFRVKL